MTAVLEIFVRRTLMTSLLFVDGASGSAQKILSDDPNRVWASFQFGEVATNLGITTDPFTPAPLFSPNQPNTCYFQPGQGACYFETSGTNELYVVGGFNAGATTNICITTVVKQPKAILPAGLDCRLSTRIITECGGGAVTFANGFAPLLPADLTRRRAHVKVDNANAFSALCDGVTAANFMPVAPFFPGYAVVEGTEALAFADFGTGPTSAWWIVDREVPA